MSTVSFLFKEEAFFLAGCHGLELLEGGGGNGAFVDTGFGDFRHSAEWLFSVLVATSFFKHFGFPPGVRRDQRHLT